MKKKLKDYLHYHMGCSVFVFPAETIKSGWLKKELKKLPDLQYSYLLDFDCYHRVLHAGYLPILRPYSSMTDAECLEWANLYFTDHVTADELKIDRKFGSPIIQFFDARIQLREIQPEIFYWLLSKNFDVFGLIDEGIAIDWTLIQNNI